MLAIPALTSPGRAGAYPTPSKPHSVVSVNPRGTSSLLDREPVLAVTASGDLALACRSPIASPTTNPSIPRCVTLPGRAARAARLVVKVPRRAVVPVAIAAGVVLLSGIVLVVRLVNSGGKVGGSSATRRGRPRRSEPRPQSPKMGRRHPCSGGQRNRALGDRLLRRRILQPTRMAAAVARYRRGQPACAVPAST